MRNRRPRQRERDRGRLSTTGRTITIFIFGWRRGAGRRGGRIFAPERVAINRARSLDRHEPAEHQIEVVRRSITLRTVRGRLRSQTTTSMTAPLLRVATHLRAVRGGVQEVPKRPFDRRFGVNRCRHQYSAICPVPSIVKGTIENSAKIESEGFGGPSTSRNTKVPSAKFDG